MSLAAALLSCACGGAKHRNEAPEHVAEQCPARVPRLVTSHDEKVVPLQCTLPEDCGARAHAESMFCEHDGSCRAVCEDHWGDCNHDYRDGCETPIEHPVFCADDPHIEEEKNDNYNPPEVALQMEGEGAGAGRFDHFRFTYGLDCHRHELESCYRQVLTRKPGLKAIMFYEFALGEGGRVTASKLVQSNTPSQELEVCVMKFVATVRFKTGPKGGTVTFPYRVVFIPGYFDAEVE